MNRAPGRESQRKGDAGAAIRCYHMEMSTISHPNDAERRFLPSALRYWRRQWLFLSIAAAGFALGLFALRVPERLFPWVAGAAASLVAASLVIYFMTPKLDCTACGGATDVLVEYCPSCGEEGLVVDRWRGTICGSCKRALGRYKTRTYRIRFCTHCGVLLSRRGV